MPQPAKLCLQGTREAICRFSPECVAGFWMIFGLNTLGDEGKAILHRDELVLGVTTAATLWFVTVMGLCFGGGQIGLGDLDDIRTNLQKAKRAAALIYAHFRKEFGLLKGNDV